MRLCELQDEMPCEFRHGRARSQDGSFYGTSWQRGELRVQRLHWDVPKEFRSQTKYWRKGEVCLIHVAGVAIEARPDDCEEVDGEIRAHLDGGCGEDEHVLEIRDPRNG